MFDEEILAVIRKLFCLILVENAVFRKNFPNGDLVFSSAFKAIVIVSTSLLFSSKRSQACQSPR
jgi:hypothetical protein